MKFAPELPTTEMLEAMHPLSEAGQALVAEKRMEIDYALSTGDQLVLIAGPCAAEDRHGETLKENEHMTRRAETLGILAIYRDPIWKPRSSAKDWHGLETTNPEMAHRLARDIAEQNGNFAAEIGDTRHIKRYSKFLALAWKGSRNEEDVDLITAIAEHDDTLPLLIKNGMDGHIESALLQANDIAEKRLAPALVLFRGGSEFTTPEAWVNQYRRALDMTDGKLAVDAAHGGEQAHDLAGNFTKSKVGQLACLESIIRVAEVYGEMPLAVMTETSNINGGKSPTDPVISIEDAFEALKKLTLIKRQTTATAPVAAD